MNSISILMISIQDSSSLLQQVNFDVQYHTPSIVMQMSKALPWALIGQKWNTIIQLVQRGLQTIATQQVACGYGSPS